MRSALRRQPASPAPGDFALYNATNNGGLLRIGYRSPGSGIGVSGSEIADSLRRIFEIFPFSGDWGRRPGSICTAWPSLQCHPLKSPPWPPKPRPRGENVVDLMDALKKSIGQESAAPARGKKRKAAADQKEMLLPISGKKKEETKKAAKAPAARARKRA